MSVNAVILGVPGKHKVNLGMEFQTSCVADYDVWNCSCPEKMRASPKQMLLSIASKCQQLNIIFKQNTCCCWAIVRNKCWHSWVLPLEEWILRALRLTANMCSYGINRIFFTTSPDTVELARNKGRICMRCSCQIHGERLRLWMKLVVTFVLALS